MKNQNSDVAVSVKPNWDFPMVAVAIVLAFHWRAILGMNATGFNACADGWDIEHGAALIHSWRDTLRWWHGGWIHLTLPYYRPIASYAMCADLMLAHRGLYWAPVAITGLLWCGSLILSGHLAARITGQPWTAYAVIPAGALYHCKLFADNADWLIYWPMQDSELCILFFLGAMLAFDLWAEQGRARFVALAVVLSGASAFTKEIGYFLPFALLILALYRREFQWRFVGLLAACSVVASAAAVIKFACVPFPYAPGGVNILTVIRSCALMEEVRELRMFGFAEFSSRSFWEPGLFMTAVIQLGFFVALAFTMWRAKKTAPWVCAGLFCVLSLLAVPNFVPSGEYWVLPICLSGPLIGLVCVSLRKSAAWCRSRHRLLRWTSTVDLSIG